MSIQVNKQKRTKYQLQQRIQSLRKVYHYFDNKDRWITLSELRKDLNMSPNIIHRCLIELKYYGCVFEAEIKGKERKKGRRRYFASKRNIKLVEHFQDINSLYFQRKRA